MQESGSVTSLTQKKYDSGVQISDAGTWPGRHVLPTWPYSPSFGLGLPTSKFCIRVTRQVPMWSKRTKGNHWQSKIPEALTNNLRS